MLRAEEMGAYPAWVSLRSLLQKVVLVLRTEMWHVVPGIALARTLPGAWQPGPRCLLKGLSGEVSDGADESPGGGA